ncbi:hypothetical protein GOP47_0017388 [Adiantum capillus-veneris]|uniref:PsbP C-terminal domain-containing protein n=1 Tax=Adiantum capillus-veneris TaxID=13818 RepID=A0A9D4UFC3_ADICA|nr:hypothetical protein GOP47_0017388 [Adiantum capillus-veneris]
MATGCASCVATLPAHCDLSRLSTPSARPRCSLPAFDNQSTSLARLSGLTITRRELAGHLLFSLLAVPSLPALASDEKSESLGDYSQYISNDDNYSLLIPADWIKGTGTATGQRSVTAFYPTDDTSVSVNVLITAVGPDYTSLGSFGTLDAFAETVVNSIDRSWKRPPGQAAKLVDSKSNKGLYYIEYTVQKPGEKKRHLLSVVGMRFNGWYNRLYTVTGQFWEDDKAKYGPLLDKVVESFKFA